MTRIKIIALTALCTVTILLIVSFFSPYNVLKKITEENIVHDQGIAVLFNEDEIEDISYIGSHTYIITANSKKFVAVQDYYSFMNYKWYVYEKINEWG